MLSAQDVSSFLSRFIKLKIKMLAGEFIGKKYPDIKYAVAALGSFGAGEMTFSSDIDLVFIVENMDLYPEVQSDFQKLFLIIKDFLKPVDVDCRLRPEGKSSILVWDLKSYQLYVKKRARIWELQAFCKLDYIAGDKKIVTRLSRSIHKRIATEPEEKIRKDIADMRMKLSTGPTSSFPKFFNIKKSGGGIGDIDFLMQFLILITGNFSKLRGKGIIKSLSFFVDNYEQYAELKSLNYNYTFLKNLDMINQTIFNSSSSIVPADEKKLNTLAQRMDVENGDNLQKILIGIVKTNRLTFSKYVG